MPTVLRRVRPSRTSYSANALPITRLSRSSLVMTVAVATGFVNGRPVSGSTPVKNSPLGSFTGRVGGAVSASNMTDAAPPFGSTCACDRLSPRRLPTRNRWLMLRSRFRRNDPRLRSEPITTPSFCSRLPDR